MAHCITKDLTREKENMYAFFLSGQIFRDAMREPASPLQEHLRLNRGFEHRTRSLQKGNWIMDMRPGSDIARDEDVPL